MVLTHTTNYSYNHPFPTVTLAYFLRYFSPKINPFANHVLSTDTLESHVDPATGRLHTTRVHLKRSRLPKAVVKLLPQSITGGMADQASYILETSVVDIREGWMQTESKNLNFAGVLSVVERQLYTAAAASAQPATTGVETSVVFRSRLGERIRERIGQGGQRGQAQEQAQEQPAQEAQPRQGWFASTWVGGLGAKGIQRSIETIASTKTQDQLGKSREGMRAVLERLRKGGVLGVLEMRRAQAMNGGIENI